MVGPRSRSFTASTPKGVASRFGSTSEDYQVVSSYSGCSDITGPGDCDPLTIDHWLIEGGLINKPNVGNYFIPYFKNYRADITDSIGQFNHLSFTDDLPDDVTIATEAAARTNPSRPSLSVITNLLELGDIVRLMKDTVFQLKRDATKARRSFKGAARAGGNSWLLGLFGVAPLVRDLSAVSQFASLYIQRCKEINRLRTQNGLRRTVTYDCYTTSASSAKVCQSNWGAFIAKQFNVVTALKIRAHCRWLPAHGFDEALHNGDMARRVRNAVLGAEVNLSTLWDGIPWSWLVNWAYDVGAFQRASLNIIPATLSGVHVMRHTTTEWTCGSHSDSDLSMTPIRVILERKTRVPSFVSPTAHFPDRKSVV